MTEVCIEKRKRGIFGRIFLIVFVFWNVFMLSWTIAAMSAAADSSADAGIAFFIVLFSWAIGSVVTGLLAFVTSGGKTIIRNQ